MIKILFADDDLKYSMLLKSFLQQHGYDVTYAGNGKKAWEQFPEVKPDLVLLDINMPEMDGYEVAERIRTIDPKVLIFFLTDRTEKNDRLKGFSLKANDYLAKPFYPEELLARIEERFSMNESETIEEEVYHFGETTFSYNNNELRTRSSRVLITSRQADILRLLAKNIGNVVSKEMIQEAVWGTVSYANSLAVNVQMTYLRHALQHDVTVKIESLKKRDMFCLLFLQSNDDVASAIVFQTSCLNGFAALFQNIDGFDLAGRNLVEFLFSQFLLSALDQIVRGWLGDRRCGSGDGMNLYHIAFGCRQDGGVYLVILDGFTDEFLAGEVWDAFTVDGVDTQGVCLGCHAAGYAQQGKCNGENKLFHKLEMFYN